MIEEEVFQGNAVAAQYRQQHPTMSGSQKSLIGIILLFTLLIIFVPP